MRTSSGVHPPLALFRVGPPIFPSANARAVVVVAAAVPFADAARDRARAPTCPRVFPVVPPRPRLLLAVAPFSSPPSLSPFATSRARARDVANGESEGGDEKGATASKRRGRGGTTGKTRGHVGARARSRAASANGTAAATTTTARAFADGKIGGPTRKSAKGGWTPEEVRI